MDDARDEVVGDHFIAGSGDHFKADDDRPKLHGNQIDVDGGHIRVTDGHFEAEGDDFKVNGDQFKVDGNHVEVGDGHRKVSGDHDILGDDHLKSGRWPLWNCR